ncbi:uncharacterized protein LOC130138414 [Syzygium oleosum]|uniref:uncharacterized protein LOC130138414 n=1 Tax=Syzygium oleosum TaxID=219896 RepID=UPI0024B9D670|nr:uncharacterized protein LOC130138414 [Syzygium oleosum]
MTFSWRCRLVMVEALMLSVDCSLPQESEVLLEDKDGDLEDFIDWCLKALQLDRLHLHTRTVDSGSDLLVIMVLGRSEEFGVILMEFWTLLIQGMCTEHLQERIELIHALHKDRKLHNLPKLAKSQLIICRAHDKECVRLVHPFPFIVLNVNGNAQLVVIKYAGHAIIAEKPKEMYKILKSFPVHPLAPHGQGNQMNGRKAD